MTRIINDNTILPVLGVVHVPVTAVTYLGGRGVGAFKEEKGERKPIQCQARTTPVVMVASRSHGGEAVEKLEAHRRFEIAHHPRDRGLADAELPRRTGHGPAGHRRLEGFERAEVEDLIILY